MSNLDTQNINVLNYNENEVFVDSAKDHYKFSASRDGKTPAIIPIPLSELQNICSNTEIIITGWLTFDEEMKEKTFKELRIPNWKEILSNDDIEDILTKPTLDGLQKIINIENQTYFDRIRIIMFKLMKNGVDITMKVSRIVNQRYEELRERQRVSSLTLTKKDTLTTVLSEDLRALSEQNTSLQSQLDEMKNMMEQMALIKTNEPTSTTQDIADTSKKVGRPKKTAN